MVSLVSDSLSAVDQIQGSKTQFRKRMWFLFLSISSLLALYQTYQLISDYLQIQMSSSLSEEFSTDSYEYTICFGNPIYSENNTNQIVLKMKSLNSSCNVTSPSLFCLSLLTERERYDIGFDVRKPFQIYFDKHVKRMFNNLYHGNCITTEEKAIFSEIGIILVPEMKLEIFFHEKKTLPVLKPEDAAEIFSAFELYMVIHFKKIIFLDNSWPYNSVCAVNGPNITGWNNFYKNDDNILPYKYSKKGCLDQCLYNLTLAYCHCIIPHSMTGENVNRLPICSRICNKIPQTKLDAKCGCKTPCQDVEITVETYQSKLDEFGSQTANMMSATIMENYNKPFGFVPFEHDRTIARVIDNQFMPVSYSLTRSHLANVECKQPPLKFEDVLSSIGGVWGIWIGLSCSALLSMGLKALFNAFPSAHNEFSKKFIYILYNFTNYLRLVAIGLAYVWQTYIIIDEYLKFNIISIETIEPLDSFPTIYVCPIPTIYIEGVDDATLKENVNLGKKLKTLEMMLSDSNFDNGTNFLDYYKNNFSREEKLVLVPKISDFILKCEFVTDTGLKLPCMYDSYIVLDNESVFCAVIRHQKTNHNNQALQFTNLNMQVRAVRNNFIMGENIKTKIGLNPFIAFSDIVMSKECFKNKFTVEPGDLVEATFTLTERQRLAVPYSSKCIPENSNYTEISSFAELGFNFDYLYTYKECLHFCSQYTKDNVVNLAENVKNCNCHQPCTENEYELKRKKKKYFSKKKMNLDQFHNLEDYFDYSWNGTAEVRISRGSYTKKVIKEKPANDPFNLVGMIGGISGLWIGQSILSLILEIQFMTSIIIKTLKNKFNKKI